jgi:aminopeptidase N
MTNSSNAPKTTYLKDYQPPHFEIESVHLDFSLAPHETIVTNTMKVRCLDKDEPILFNGEKIKLLEIQLNGQVADKEEYQLTDDGLLLTKMPTEFELTIRNSFSPIDNKALSGLYMSADMYCTQCEAEGFRRITFFPDRPDVLSIFTTTIRADKSKYPILLSNGNPIDAMDLDNGQHEVTWNDPHKKPCYLFALVAGDLSEVSDQFITRSGSAVRLAFYVREQDAHRCQHAIDSLKNAMAWDEKSYGLEYDLDIYMIVAVSDFNMGAMENKGLNIFNTKYVLADPETATDKDYQLVEAVIGHEYFHNWTGNRVTCQNWFQLSLKEGLTVFREHQFSSERGSPGVTRIEQANLMQTRQFIEDSSPLSHPVLPSSYIEINNFYTLTIYEKGCEVIRMLHTLLGEDGFKKGMETYFKRHDGQAVRIEDFIQAHSDANEKDLTQFSRWYHQAGTPHLKVEGHWSAESKKYQLVVEQSCQAAPGDETPKEPLLIPLKVELLSTSGAVLFKECVLELTKARQTFVFEEVSEKPVVALLGGFSAPVSLAFPYHNREYGCLLRYSSDSYVRWNAAQQLVLSGISHLAHQQSENKGLLVDSEVFSDFEPVIAEDNPDLSFKALLLTLPSFNWVAQHLSQYDLDGLWTVYDHFVKYFATQLNHDWEKVYRHHYGQRSDSLERQAIGHRQMANISLFHWVNTDADMAQEMAIAQYHSAFNMTERLGALSAVNHSDNVSRQTLLDDYERRFEDNALAMDKWFALQAGSYRDDTFDRVETLLHHPKFDLQNPNKVYALLNTFAHNERHFHHASGRGYRLVADHIQKIDAFNPQVSARLASSFSSWKRLDTARQDNVKKTIGKVLSAQNLSNDTYEILSKIIRH